MTHIEIDGEDMSEHFDGPAIPVPDDQEIVGRLHYRGDVRGAQVMTYPTARFGLVYPIAAEFDEEAHRSTVYFAGLRSMALPPAIEGDGLR